MENFTEVLHFGNPVRISLMEKLQSEPKVKPVYATYSFWFLFAILVAILIMTLDLSIKVYKFNYVMEYLWNATMNTSIYDILRQAKSPVEDFIPFK
jgi:surface polysaccharide O-acyltransferase-like enzyme